mmetsp:Transcript_17289/g.54080  ORF Transcript_17289/g.54080 Transcript_17289/m.54080 type:complete len:265 (+) Transcript_17289:594-1388(+)
MSAGQLLQHLQEQPPHDLRHRRALVRPRRRLQLCRGRLRSAARGGAVPARGRLRRRGGGAALRREALDDPGRLVPAPPGDGALGAELQREAVQVGGVQGLGVVPRARVRGVRRRDGGAEGQVPGLPAAARAAVLALVEQPQEDVQGLAGRARDVVEDAEFGGEDAPWPREAAHQLPALRMGLSDDDRVANQLVELGVAVHLVEEEGLPRGVSGRLREHGLGDAGRTLDVHVLAGDERQEDGLFLLGVPDDPLVQRLPHPRQGRG